MNCIIIRYGEIALKGKNRITFERRLIRNIKDALKKNNVPFEQVQRLRNRILIHTENECPFLKNVFGISSFSRATISKTDIDSIEGTISPLLKKIKKTDSFRVSAKKITSETKVKSIEINKEIALNVADQMTDVEREECINFESDGDGMWIDIGCMARIDMI